MGSWLDGLLGRTSRKLTKLKTLLGLTVSRLALLRSQRHSRCEQAQADVAQLLLLGHLDRALLRVELVIKERNMIDVLAMVEGYCHLLTERAFLLHNQTQCPEELREAAAGLAFAASRCGDLPELREVRRIFSSRFGKEFTVAAAELRNNCGVSGKMVQKFSTRQPSLEIRAKVAKEIAMQKGIKVELTEPNPENTEDNQSPNLKKKKKKKNDQAQTAMEPPASACDLQELLVDEKLLMMAQEKYKDVESAARAAIESAAFAAVAARTAIELYRSESQTRNSVDSSHLKQSRRREIYSPTGINCSSIDLGCRASKVSSLQIEIEKSRGKEILSDEGDSDEELIWLASKALVPMSRAQSFAAIREQDLKVKNQSEAAGHTRNQSADKPPNENADMTAIVAVEPSKKTQLERSDSEESIGENIAARNSCSGTNCFSVRARK